MATCIKLFGPSDSWLAQNKHLFHSEQSLRWHVRKHQRKLAQAGALVRLRGSWFAVEPKFTQALLKTGREEALAAVREAEAA